MPSHDLDDECSRVRAGGAGDGVDGLANSVKSGESSDGKIGHGHVVAVDREGEVSQDVRSRGEEGADALDGPDDSDNVEVSVGLGLLLRNLSCGHEGRVIASEGRRRPQRKQKVEATTNRSQAGTRQFHSTPFAGSPLR